MDDRFKSLIEMPLSTLNDVPSEELPVIVIDGLDKCSGLRHNASAKDNYKDLSYMLKHWAQVNQKVQIDHYQLTGGPYQPNLPRIHQYSYRYSLWQRHQVRR